MRFRFIALSVTCLTGVVALSPVMLGVSALHVAARSSAIPPEVLAANPGARWTTARIAARDGARLEGSFARPASDSGRCVLVLHGIGDTRSGSSGFAPMFLSAGYGALFPDSRGHGRSGGELVTYGVLEKLDVVDWVGWLRSQGCREIFGLGESLGAATLIQAAPLAQDLRAIVAECPYSDLRAIGEFRVRQVAHLPVPIARGLVDVTLLFVRMRYGLDLRQASALNAIAHTTTPILLIHGLADSQTPYRQSQLLAQADPRAQLWLVPGAGHVAAYSADPGEFQRRVLGWFARNSDVSGK